MATTFIAGDGLEHEAQEIFLEWVELFDEVHAIEGNPVDMEEAIHAYLRAHPEDDRDTSPIF